MAEYNESLLIGRAKAGDNQAFELLMRHYLNSVYFFLFQLVREGALAEDLTQESFLKAWQNLHRFDETKKFRTWIFTIAKHTAFDALRKKREIPLAYLPIEEEEGILETIEDTQPTPDEIVERALTATELWKKIETLPVAYQVLLTLHYREGFSLEEIASLLEVPYNTIKSRHTRAIKLFRQVYQDSYASESSKAA